MTTRIYENQDQAHIAQLEAEISERECCRDGEYQCNCPIKMNRAG